MSFKLLVLYPQPADSDEFERQYAQHHLPLMRELVGPGVPLPTYLIQGTAGHPAPYYRTAEIHFKDSDHFDEFVRSGKSKIGLESSIKVSTGGKPIFLLCRELTAS